MPIRHLLWLLGLLFTLIPASAFAADSLETVRKSGKLRWCADQEGGGPFVYPADDNPDVLVGFEVEMAEVLAKYLKVQPEFIQGQWDKLPEMLDTERCDVILNGYEWLPERLDGMDPTVPYYVYGLQLLTNKNDAGLKTWEDLRKPDASGEKRKIGVLTGSAAEAYMRDNYGEDTEVINYDGVTDTMREVETGKLSATLQDTPIASFYGPRFPLLQPLGEPVGKGYYVMFVRKGQTGLVSALNEAVLLSVRNGELERIYRRYNMWDANQQELVALTDAGKFYGYANAVLVEVEKAEMPTEEDVQALSARKRGWEVVRTYGVTLIEAAGMTILLSFLSFPLAILAGIAIAVGRMYGPAWIRVPLTLHVEFIRGTPLMLQLYFIFFLLPDLGIVIDAFPTAILGLAINYSAYESEIYRAGLQAIPVGQMEAALALGMSRAQAIRRIIVPQAFRIVIPPVMNDFIALFKDTSVCSVVTIVELTKRFSALSLSTQATVELMGMTALLYLGMSYPMSILSRNLERRLARES